MPVITISRMFGSGGSEVAARVADGLGWTLLDNALVERVAARLGRTPVEVQAIEERVPSLAERLADALALGSPEIVSPALSAPFPPTEERLLEVTERVIDDAVARGPVVLVGRGAQSYLAQRTDALHVFCYASRPALIAPTTRPRPPPSPAPQATRRSRIKGIRAMRRDGSDVRPAAGLFLMSQPGVSWPHDAQSREMRPCSKCIRES